MAFSVTARGGLGKLDPLDNSLVLLSLHSACLGIAGGFLGKSELSDTFNIPWMLTGFSIGAVLAVLAGYYGLVNNGALRDYLTSTPSEATPPERRSDASPALADGTDLAEDNGTISSINMSPAHYTPPCVSRRVRSARSSSLSYVQ
jgi:hypothetical protein